MAEKSGAVKTRRKTALVDSADDARLSSATAIYQHLAKLIVAGELLPGAAIDEAQLCQKFDVSRTPVREALLKLAAVELVQFRPRQGAVVASLPLARILQMFEVMAELSALCAARSAERMTLSERKQLRAAQQECDACAKQGGTTAGDKYFDANYRFHEAIYRGSHNDFLAETTINLRNRLNPYRRFRRQNPARLKISTSEHDQIAKAIVAGDADAAFSAMLGHVTVQASVLADIASFLSE